MRRILVLMICSVVLYFTGCSNIPTPPIYQSISLDHKKSTSASEFRVKDGNYYSFNIFIHFKSGDVSDTQRVERLAGTLGSDVRTDLSRGIPLPLSLKITKIEGSARFVIADIKVSSFGVIAVGGGYFCKEMFRLHLDKGDYEAVVTSLSDIPELSNEKTSFAIFTPYAGK